MQIPAAKAAATTSSPPLAIGRIAPSAVPKAVPNGTPGPAIVIFGATAANMPMIQVLTFIVTLPFEVTAAIPESDRVSPRPSANFGDMTCAQFPCLKSLFFMNQPGSRGRNRASRADVRFFDSLHGGHPLSSERHIKHPPQPRTPGALRQTERPQCD